MSILGKLDNYLSESEDRWSTIEMMKATVPVLEKECKPFMKDLKKAWKQGTRDFLWSGRDVRLQGVTNFIRGKVRKNRRPLDTDIDISNEADRLFKKYYGIKARSECLFTTGDQSSADHYGNSVWIIIPKGQYKILWSRYVADFYTYIREHDIMDERGRWENEDAQEKLEDVIKNDYKLGDLYKAQASYNEVMIYCKEYIAVNGRLRYDMTQYLKYGKISEI